MQRELNSNPFFNRFSIIQCTFSPETRFGGKMRKGLRRDDAFAGRGLQGVELWRRYLFPRLPWELGYHEEVLCSNRTGCSSASVFLFSAFRCFLSALCSYAVVLLPGDVMMRDTWSSALSERARQVLFNALYNFYVSLIVFSLFMTAYNYLWQFNILRIFYLISYVSPYLIYFTL